MDQHKKPAKKEEAAQKPELGCIKGSKVGFWELYGGSTILVDSLRSIGET